MDVQQIEISYNFKKDFKAEKKKKRFLIIKIFFERIFMTRRYKPAIPSNIQALVNANELHAAAVEQSRIERARQNETRFREEHASVIHNADVRRNVRRSQEEARLARLDLIIDRRTKLAELFETERLAWNQELQARGYTISST